MQQPLVPVTPAPSRSVEPAAVVFGDRISALDWAVSEGVFANQESASKQYDAWQATWKPETQTVMFEKWVNALRYMTRRAQAIQKAMNVKAFSTEKHAREEFDSIRKGHPKYTQNELFQAWDECLLSITKIGKAVKEKYGEKVTA